METNCSPMDWALGSGDSTSGPRPALDCRCRQAWYRTALAAPQRWLRCCRLACRRSRFSRSSTDSSCGAQRRQKFVEFNWTRTGVVWYAAVSAAVVCLSFFLQQDAGPSSIRRLAGLKATYTVSVPQDFGAALGASGHRGNQQPKCSIVAGTTSSTEGRDSASRNAKEIPGWAVGAVSSCSRAGTQRRSGRVAWPIDTVLPTNSGLDCCIVLFGSRGVSRGLFVCKGFLSTINQGRRLSGCGTLERGFCVGDRDLGTCAAVAVFPTGQVGAHRGQTSLAHAIASPHAAASRPARRRRSGPCRSRGATAAPAGSPRAPRAAPGPSTRRGWAR